jgi:hypothetical protein
MVQATIPYRGGELEVSEEGEIWTVRLGELEESSPYLDFALAQLLDDDTARVHQLALKLIEAIEGQRSRQEAFAVARADASGPAN